MNGAKAPETPSSVLQEKTVTPETLPTVVGPDEGYDGLSQVTVNPDSQLKAENIRSGKTIFGVDGSFVGEPVYETTDLVSYCYENGVSISSQFNATYSRGNLKRINNGYSAGDTYNLDPNGVGLTTSTGFTRVSLTPYSKDAWTSPPSPYQTEVSLDQISITKITIPLSVTESNPVFRESTKPCTYTLRGKWYANPYPLDDNEDVLEYSGTGVMRYHTYSYSMTLDNPIVVNNIVRKTFRIDSYFENNISNIFFWCESLKVTW